MVQVRWPTACVGCGRTDVPCRLHEYNAKDKILIGSKWVDGGRRRKDEYLEISIPVKAPMCETCYKKSYEIRTEDAYPDVKVAILGFSTVFSVSLFILITLLIFDVQISNLDPGAAGWIILAAFGGAGGIYSIKYLIYTIGVYRRISGPFLAIRLVDKSGTVAFGIANPLYLEHFKANNPHLLTRTLTR
jgi:hypothetical protein